MGRTIRMMTVKRLTCLWPGLTRLWFRGQWSALANACAFAALVNLLIVTTLLWTEVAPGSLRLTGWALVIIWWLGAAALSLREITQITASNAPDANQGLFVTAQTEYLKGNWIEAETCVRKMLRRGPRELEPALLLASILRRTKGNDEARLQLQEIARLDAASQWQVELRKERELLRREAQQEQAEQQQETESPFSESVTTGDRSQTPTSVENHSKDPSSPQPDEVQSVPTEVTSPEPNRPLPRDAA